MVKNYFRIALRNLWKNRFFISINMLGMGVAIACCIVAYLNGQYDKEFDATHENSANIYRISFEREFNGKRTKFGIAPLPMAHVVRENISEVDAVVRFQPSTGNFRVNDDMFSLNIGYVEDKFFDFFTIPLQYGSPDGLADKSSIYISQEQAMRLFSREDVVGEMITHILNDGQLKEYVVAGVFVNRPTNDSFRNQSYINYANMLDNNPELTEDNWKTWATTFVWITEPAKVARVEERLKEYITIQNQAREDLKVSRYFVEPLEGMAQRVQDEQYGSHWLTWSMPKAAVYIPMVMAVLILLIACFNFTNTSIALAGKRLKEIGVRKVMGSMRKQLFAQFMIESLVLCFLSLVVGLVFAAFLVPAYSQMWDFLHIELSFRQNPELFGFLAGLLVFTGLVAGAYPAMYISGFEPVSILKGTFKFRGTNLLTRSLLVLQYSISLIAVIAGVAFVLNANYQQQLDYGFNTQEVLYARLTSQAEVETYRNALQSNPEIHSIALSEHQLFSSVYNDPVGFEGVEIETDIMHVGDNYIETMGITLLSGRGFRVDSETDRQESIIVSEQFVREFGWTEAVGKQVVWLDTARFTIVGVVKDIYSQGMWELVQPMMLRYSDPEKNRHVVVSTSRENLLRTFETMEAEWKKLFPTKVFNGRYQDDNLRNALMINANAMKMFVFLGLVALVLSITSLYTMVSLNIQRRTKEIGVRKVLGASVGQITRVVNKEFIMMLAIACVLGCIMSYFAIGSMMGTIWKYYMPLEFHLFVGSVTALLLVSAISVGFKVYRAATANPVHSLRTE
jgi:putative ABC transport system permease protein